jgi:hypothetical protein
MTSRRGTVVTSPNHCRPKRHRTELSNAPAGPAHLSRGIRHHIGVRARSSDTSVRTGCYSKLGRTTAPLSRSTCDRLKGRKGEWINKDCSREYSSGRYISSHGDNKRLTLAQAPEAIASFSREAPTPILALGHDVEAALPATLGKQADDDGLRLLKYPKTGIIKQCDVSRRRTKDRCIGSGLPSAIS